MTYKLLLIRNRFTKKIDVKKYLEWFKKNTPIDVVIVDEISTDFELSTQPISNDTFRGVIAGPAEDLYPKLRSIVPEGKYHAVVLVYGNKLKGIRMNVAPRMPLYFGTDLIQIVKSNDGGKMLNHEIFHTLFHRLQRQQIMIEDPMDKVYYNGKWRPYFNNSSLTANPSNRTIALERLAPYWDKIPLLGQNAPIERRVEIIRNNADPAQTTGILEAYNGLAKFTCRTLELAWLNNVSNISSIPKGTYLCKWTFSPRFLRFTYEVINVPNRTGIRFHPANYFHQLNGCIALGNNLVDINGDGHLDTVNSKATIALFENFMGKEPFTLSIM